MKEEEFLLWLSLIDGLSNVKKFRLLQIYNTAENIFNSTFKELEALIFLNNEEINKILNHKKFNLNEYLLKLENNNIKYYSFFNSEYPDKLRDIDTPPLLIYLKGTPVYNNIPVVTIIGSRRCTEYGKRVAYEFSKELAKSGVTVLSGLAYGIDTFANKGAVEANGNSIAVLGCSVDICYPKENRELKSKIEENGCTLSEYPVSTEPRSHHFPIRNRIMSGMSDGVIVVESSIKSGTSITVNYALDYGREVFAVPGSIYNKSSFGTNQLLKEGAIPITSVDDVINHLKIEVKDLKKEDIEIKKTYISLTEKENKILKFITETPIEVEKILIETNLPINEIQTNLTLLELKNLIIRLPGQRYMLKI